MSYNITDETSANAVFSFTCSRETAERLLGQDVRQYAGSIDALKSLIDRLNAISFAPNTVSNTSISSSFVGNEPAGNSLGEQPQTGSDRISISKRLFPIIGKYLLTRVNLDTGDYQVSLDDGATWLFMRIDPETRQAEYSADGVNWDTMPAS